MVHRNSELTNKRLGFGNKEIILEIEVAVALRDLREGVNYIM